MELLASTAKGSARIELTQPNTTVTLNLRPGAACPLARSRAYHNRVTLYLKDLRSTQADLKVYRIFIHKPDAAPPNREAKGYAGELNSYGLLSETGRDVSYDLAPAVLANVKDACIIAVTFVARSGEGGVGHINLSSIELWGDIGRPDQSSKRSG